MEVGASLSHDMRGIREKLHLGALVDTKQRVAGLRVNPSRAGGPEMPSPAYLSLEQRAPLPSWPLRVPPPFAPRKPPLYLTQRQPQCAVSLPLCVHGKSTSQLCSPPVQAFIQQQLLATASPKDQRQMSPHPLMGSQCNVGVVEAHGTGEWEPTGLGGGREQHCCLSC